MKSDNKGRKLVSGRKKQRSQAFAEGSAGQAQIDAWNNLSAEERAWIAEQQAKASKRPETPANPARTPKQAGKPSQVKAATRRTDNGL